VRDIVIKAVDRATDVLRNRRDDLDEGAHLLLTQETVTADQFPAIRSAGPQTKAAAKVAPYRHPPLSAIRVAGDVNAQVGLGDDASIEELRAKVLHHLEVLAPVLRIEMQPTGIANRDEAKDGVGNDAGAAG
jgi:hypothetical protein